MFANLMVLWAQTFVIISDETQINKYTSLTFRTSNDRLKYSLLVYYVEKLRLQTYFFDVMKIIHQNVISHSRKSSVLEIKLLFATAIINHFCLGDFNIELFDLAPHITADVFGHLDVFCSSDRQMVLDSLWTSFERFTYQDYIRERSCLYLSNLYTEYCYEILKYQMDNNLWSWRHSATFKRVLGRHVSCVSLYLSFALENKEHNYVNYSISAYDVISKHFTYTNGMNFILSLNDASVKILILYSYDEVALATKKYEHNCIRGIQKSSLITPSYATRFNNLWYTRMVLKRLIIDYGISKHCMICRNTFHDLFYNTEKDVSDIYTLEDWIIDALAYLDNLDAARKFFLDWYNKK